MRQHLVPVDVTEGQIDDALFKRLEGLFPEAAAFADEILGTGMQ